MHYIVGGLEKWRGEGEETKRERINRYETQDDNRPRTHSKRSEGVFFLHHIRSAVPALWDEFVGAVEAIFACGSW